MLLVPIPASKSSNIKCFNCLAKGHISFQFPNKRSMNLREDGTVDSKSSRNESSSINETCSSINNFSPNDGDLLMVRCSMSAHVGQNDDSQRENIFHSCCHILGKLCSIIIDDGNCVNVVSLRLVEKLNLPTLWLNRKGEIGATKQVSLAFTLGKYSNEVLCDIVPMEATQILLGRP
ncbi:hypothetical protein CR513_48179, partial [Mucuna pruriens]